MLLPALHSGCSGNLASFINALASFHTGLCTANDPDLVPQSGIEDFHLSTTAEYNTTVEVQAKAPPQDVAQTLKGKLPVCRHPKCIPRDYYNLNNTTVRNITTYYK